VNNKMPSRSRSVSRGRASKRARSGSRGSGMYAAAMRSRSLSSRRYRKSRYMPKVQGNHVFSRALASETYTLSATELGVQREYKFNEILSVGEFSTLFENYQINMVTVKIQLITNPDATYATNQGGSIGNYSNWYPRVWYAVDPDGGVAETIASMKERQSVKCKVLQPGSFVKISFVPNCRTLAYKTSTTEGFTPKNIKIDMVDTDVPHYGLSMVFDTMGIDPNDTYPFKINVETKYRFTCSGVR